MSPVRLWTLALGSSVLISGVVLTLATRTVQAHALLAHPAQPAISAPVAAPTPESLDSDVPPANEKHIRLLHGIASWYGSIFHGRKTASGERFNMYAMTACHPTLPFGTKVRVVNLENHKSVVVRITDRGDLVEEGRIIDLSYAAAQRLAMTHEGLAKVELQVISLGHPNQK